jgi:hypothetical protein
MDAATFRSQVDQHDASPATGHQAVVAPRQSRGSSPVPAVRPSPGDRDVPPAQRRVPAGARLIDHA